MSINLSNAFGGGGLAPLSDCAAIDHVGTMQWLNNSYIDEDEKILVPGCRSSYKSARAKN